MTDHDNSPAGPRSSAAGRPGGLHDRPIPFTAFAPLADAPAPEVLSDVVDGRIDPAGPAPAGSAPARFAPARFAPARFAQTRGTGDTRAPVGRALIAIVPALATHADAEVLVSRLCAELGGVGPPHHARPNDLEHWAHADAVRAATVEPLGLTICAHDLPRPAHRVVVVVDCPERGRAGVTAAVARLPHAEVGAVLTDTGWVSEPIGREGELVAAAMAAQAARAGGRAMVFPGQAHLRGDTTTRSTLAATAIERVHSVQGDVRADAVLRCHGYARPGYRDGALTLAVACDTPDLLVAIEVRYSRPCCGTRTEGGHGAP